jgi:hypothetical protein
VPSLYVELQRIAQIHLTHNDPAAWMKATLPGRSFLGRLGMDRREKLSGTDPIHRRT